MEDTQSHLQPKHNIHVILGDLKAQLQYPWVVLPQENGIDVLLLSRDEEKSVQRRASFSFGGSTWISVHRKAIGDNIMKTILQVEPRGAVIDSNYDSVFVSNVISVIRNLQSFEVCVGVNDARFKHLWHCDKSGEKDKNPYGELRFQETFRPFQCDLLVSTAGYLRQRCAICSKVQARFAMRLRRQNEILNPSTPNVHLDRSQLLSKVVMQQKKLKRTRTKLDRLRAAFQHVLSDMDLNITKQVSDELINICLSYTRGQF